LALNPSGPRLRQGAIWKFRAALFFLIKRYVVKISILYVPNVMYYITASSKLIKINRVCYWP